MTETVARGDPRIRHADSRCLKGDAIPVHPLTREAFEVHLAHLQPEGVLAANISTSYLNMHLLLAVLARCFRLRGVVLGSDAWEMAHLASFYDLKMRIWTDMYSNLLPRLRAR